MKSARTLFAALFLAACGGGGSSSVVDPPAQGQTTPPAQPVPIAQEFPIPAGDATPAFDAEVARTCSTTNDRTLHLTAGRYVFTTRPQAIACALRIEGQGKGGTTLVRAYNGGGPFLEWVRGRDQSGGDLSELTIAAAPGTNAGTAVKVTATADSDGTVNSFNRHSFSIDNVQIGRESGDNTSWEYGIHFDGRLNPDGNPNSVPGIRAPYITRTSASGNSIASILLDTVRGGDFNVECYVRVGPSFTGLVIQNATDSIRIESRNCQVQKDATSVNITLNGVAQ